MAATATASGSSSAYASVTAGVISATSDRHGRFTALLGPTGQAHPAKSTPTQQTALAAPSAATAASGSSAALPSFHTVLVCAPVVEPIASSPAPPQQQQPQPQLAVVRSSPSAGGGSASTPPLPPGPPPPGQPRVAIAEAVGEASHVQVAFTEGGPGALPRASPPQLLPRTVTTGGVTTPALVPRTHSAVRARGPSADDGHVASSSSHRVAPHRPVGSQPPAMPYGGGGSAHGAPPGAAPVPEAAPSASADPDGWRTVGVPKRRLSGGRHTAEREAWPEVAVPWLGTAPTPAWQPAPVTGNGHAAGNGGTSDKA
jgi:hypothetical protein